MATELSLEQRLATLEEKVADLNKQLPNSDSGENWMDKVSGSFKDDPEFDEILELGRAFREADRSSVQSGPQS